MGKAIENNYNIVVITTGRRSVLEYVPEHLFGFVFVDGLLPLDTVLVEDVLHLGVRKTTAANIGHGININRNVILLPGEIQSVPYGKRVSKVILHGFLCPMNIYVYGTPWRRISYEGGGGEG